MTRTTFHFGNNFNLKKIENLHTGKTTGNVKFGILNRHWANVSDDFIA